MNDTLKYILYDEVWNQCCFLRLCVWSGAHIKYENAYITCKSGQLGRKVHQVYMLESQITLSTATL